jgi:hypothetical protein
MISGAILENLAEENRSKYDESSIYLKKNEVWKDSSKGELTDTHRAKLAQVSWNGLTLFQQGATNDIYSNVRNATLLTQTYSLLHRLKTDHDLAFTEEFTQKLLMANLSDNIENTFDWSNYLSEKLKVYDYVAKFEQDGFEKSAIKKGFSPIFSKENMLEAVGLRENYLSMYPIDAISKAGNYLRKNNVHGFPESALSQKGEMWVDVPYKGELGINHPSNALQLIYDWTPEQVLALKKKIRDDSHLKAILNSNLFKNAVTDSSGGLTFTEGALLYKKISDFADAKDVIAPEATRGQVPKANAKEAMSAGQFCLNCHNDPSKNFKNNRGKSIAMPFDPSDRNQWKTQLADEKTKDAALFWLKAIPPRLESDDTTEVCPPPLHGKEYANFKKSKDWEFWQALIKDLKEWQKPTK